MRRHQVEYSKKILSIKHVKYATRKYLTIYEISLILGQRQGS